MGICYQGKTLKESVEEKEKRFRETGYAYGLEKLELVEDDPAKFMRFQMRLVASCINAREMAKLISSNPMSVIQGELLFLFANPEGDVASASYGLAGHIQCAPYLIKNMGELGFEEDPGIDPGDIFFTNDAFYGAPHNADCYAWLPVFFENELIGWTVGLNHIVDVGGLQPGGLGTISTSVFTDGFIFPPTKTGANFKQHRWWDLHWKRRTRTEFFNILDDKMRAAGIVNLHDRILEIVEEFGIDYFRKAIREIIERERRVLLRRITMQSVPGIYNYLNFNMVKYKDMMGRLFASSNRNWLLHKPAELRILSDGRLSMNLEGLTSEGDFHCNAYEPAVRMLTSLGAWPMFAYTETINSSLMYMTEWQIPPGSMFNPLNPWAATVMGLGEIGPYVYMFHHCLSYAYFSRGFLEECFPQDVVGVGYGLTGVLADGFRWAAGDMTLITCSSSSALPYKDGDYALVCPPNPAPDMGETEQSEFLQPTNLTLGKKLIPDYCGHGKYRAGLGIGICEMIVNPGQILIAAVFGTTSGMGRSAIGSSGGYPGINDVVFFAHETNLRELLENGHPYPIDFVEVIDWIADGKLKAGNVEIFNGSTPNISLKDGDIFAAASGAKGGWGDVLERPYHLIEEDLKLGWITPGCAATVYGAVSNENGTVDIEKSDQLRGQMRKRRVDRSCNAREWWKHEREKVLKKEWHEEVRSMYTDNLKYKKFRDEFMEMWQLAENYSV